MRLLLLIVLMASDMDNSVFCFGQIRETVCGISDQSLIKDVNGVICESLVRLSNVGAVFSNWDMDVMYKNSVIHVHIDISLGSVWIALL